MSETEQLKTQVLARLTEIFRDALDDDSLVLAPTTTADDVEDWDSVSHISLMLAAEDAFDIRLNAAEVGELANIGQLVEIIASRGSS